MCPGPASNLANFVLQTCIQTNIQSSTSKHQINAGLEFRFFFVPDRDLNSQFLPLSCSPILAHIVKVTISVTDADLSVGIIGRVGRR